MRRVLPYLAIIFASLVILPFRASSIDSAPRPISQQGSSPYCLFAVTGYLTGLDMWRLEAEYHRRQLPIVNGATPADPGAVLRLASELSGRRIEVLPRNDWWAARWWVVEELRPVAFAGSGHAYVVVRIENGHVTFLDSSRDGLQRMDEDSFRRWWFGPPEGGWAWVAP